MSRVYTFPTTNLNRFLSLLCSYNSFPSFYSSYSKINVYISVKHTHSSMLDFIPPVTPPLIVCLFFRSQLVYKIELNRIFRSSRFHRFYYYRCVVESIIKLNKPLTLCYKLKALSFSEWLRGSTHKFVGES